MKLKSSPSGAPCRQIRWASSNSELLFNSSCPRMAEVLAGESNRRQLGESDPRAMPVEISFGGAILLGSHKVVWLMIISRAYYLSWASQLRKRQDSFSCGPLAAPLG